MRAKDRRTFSLNSIDSSLLAYFDRVLIFVLLVVAEEIPIPRLPKILRDVHLPFPELNRSDSDGQIQFPREEHSIRSDHRENKDLLECVVDRIIIREKIPVVIEKQDGIISSRVDVQIDD